VRDLIDTVEPKTGVKVMEYLQFGKKGDAQIKYHKIEPSHYFGELNAKNERHGRCIRIDSDGYVFIDY